MPTQHQPLSRTSSSSSVLSDGTGGTSTNDEMGPPNTPSSGVTDITPKRTRKRFTNAQLTLLEDLFHQTSHPTRDQRDTLAKEAGLELRSVTVWFQNKRQTERKVALSNGVAPPIPRKRNDPSTTTPNRSACSTPSTASSSGLIRHHRTHSSTHRYPSLDDIATRSERPHTHPPRTPPRARTHSFPDVSPNSTPDPKSPEGTSTTATSTRSTSSTRPLWENMPSSPLGPSSPERKRDRDLVDFGKRTIGSRRTWTLEWACAAARISGRSRSEESDDDENEAESDPERTIRRRGGGPSRNEARVNPVSPLKLRVNEIGVRVPVQEAEGSVEDMELDIGGDTEDEGDPPHEALTPSSSMSLGTHTATKRRIVPDNPTADGDCGTLKAKGKGKGVAKSGSGHDEEMMDAALALCGLGRT